MKSILLSLVLVLFSSMSFAHEYFFSFAEVKYNETSQQFEISIEASAHDVEDAMNEVGIAIKELEDHYTDTEMLAKIQAFIETGFSLSPNGTKLKLSLVGYEVKTNGFVYFYLKSEPIKEIKKLTIKYDWLMNQLPQQQNKLSLILLQHKSTSVFITTKRTEEITL